MSLKKLSRAWLVVQTTSIGLREMWPRDSRSTLVKATPRKLREVSGGVKGGSPDNTHVFPVPGGPCVNAKPRQRFSQRAVAWPRSSVVSRHRSSMALTLAS